LHFAAREAGSESKLMVIRTRSGLISVVVDDIGDVLELPAGDWRPPPETLAAQHRIFVTSVCPIDSYVVLGLNVDAVSSDSEQEEPSISVIGREST
jgi:purine-binding chemotaxis protein CheW